jgi:uncharacterized protein
VIQAVFDTNILASASIAKGGPMAALLEAWRARRIGVVVSQHILRELERTLRKPFFAARLDAQSRDEYLALARSGTIAAITTPVPNLASTEDDNLVLATAASASVPYLVTGDAELLRLRRYKSVSIVSAREFAALLALEDPQP